MTETTDTTDRIERRLKFLQFDLWAIATFAFAVAVSWMAATSGTMSFELAITVATLAMMGSAVLTMVSSPIIQDTVRWLVNTGRKRLGSEGVAE